MCKTAAKMTSKLHKKLTTCLTCAAIIFLVAVIVTVWILLGQGAFKTKPNSSPTSSTSSSSLPSTYQPTFQSDEKVTRNRPQHHDYQPHQPDKNTRRTKEFIQRTHLDGFGYDNQVEFVKPLKISPLPLHHQDIIFEQMRKTDEDDEEMTEMPPLRHHSGHFRHRTAEVWDPHPRYEIDAFGTNIVLELEHDDKFIAPNLHVTHGWDNYTQRFRHDSRISGCFYTGRIKGDPDSEVAVSLCNGMTGYIQKSDGESYYIEPAEKFTGEDPLGSFLHRLRKIPHQVPSSSPSTTSNDVIIEPENDDCETIDSSNNQKIVEDLGSEVVEIPKDYMKTHRIFKRQTESDWSIQYNEDRKSNEYFLKVLVVVDSSMARYHQSSDELQHYILTLMSHAALLFKGATIGNSISLSVVHIWILKDREFTTSNSQVMLKEFCSWQQAYAHKGQDTALLLTRNTICKDSSNCTTLGVAQMGSICDLGTSCSIVKDRGLSSSYTIAHELGHVLSIPHDQDKRCNAFHDGLKQNNVMSRMFQNGTKPWLWSECSKHFVTEFLESGKAKCLTEPPTQNYLTLKFARVLPGETFEVNKQCELEFGSGSKICSFMPACVNLWCTRGADEDDGCKTQYSPWAEGTTCGLRSWCHHGDCIPLDRGMLTPVDGNWGTWLPWSGCSRTCGGGVKISKRLCDNPMPENGGAYCTGKSVRYLSCNTQQCDNNVADFREDQCSRLNGNTMTIPNLTANVKWVPKYGLNNPEDLCKLYCRPENSNSYYLLKEKVEDGTKCGLNSFDICVNGICRPGGCDNQLESTLQLDECGICGGDNSKCEELTGSYNISSYGYNKVLTIPKGSSNLHIRQNGINDSHYLALVDAETRKYILNGNYVISNYQKEIIFGAIIVKYSGSSGVIETITTSKNGKLTKDLELEVLSWGKVLEPPDITYRYVINSENAPRFAYMSQKSSYGPITYVPRYGWQLYGKQWSKCNSICSGTQSISPVCVDLTTQLPQPENYCSQSEKEHQMQRRECNTHCQLLWEVQSKGPCSVNCGKGFQSVFHKCIKIEASKEHYLMYLNAPGNYGDMVDDNHCANIAKPSNVETCYGKCESTHWHYSDWSECSTSCGTGTQRRSAKCVDTDNRPLDDYRCQNSDKVTEQICNIQKCPVWSSREWTPCSVTCGRGFRTKPYYCHLDGRIYDPSACDSRTNHLEKEECVERPCTGWTAGPWNECPTNCGDDVQTREVFCENLDGHQIVQDDFCHGMLKPNVTKKCTGHNCDKVSTYQRRYDYENNDITSNSVVTGYDKRFKWITGAWSACSRPCGSGGTSSRKVVCRNELGEELDYQCNHNEKPISTIQCNSQECPNWVTGEWSVCDLNCEKHRQVHCGNSSGLVEDSRCDPDAKPETQTKCKLSQCTDSRIIPRDYFTSKENLRDRRYHWKVGKWRQCSNTCGRGVRRRHIECEDSINEVSLVDQYCQHLKIKPRAMKPCERYNCAYTWIENHWSSCSAVCGEGVKKRNVTCHKVHQGGIVDPNPLPDLMSKKVHHKNYCDLYSKPATTARCMAAKCSDEFRWRPGVWKQCSHPCGRKGRQMRLLYCDNVRTGQRVPKHYCPKNLRPPRKQKCNQWRCMYSSCKDIQTNAKTKINGDYVLSIDKRPALVYCYKMDTHEPEEYISLHGDGDNYAEIYNRRLKNPDTCPHNGQRLGTCDECLEVGPERSGLTQFWKVRINVTSLRITNDDYTFSRQNHGKKIPYGTAGDCYSSVANCGQARFSVDLTGTSFQLSEQVRWVNIGKYANSRIDRSGRKVMGLCGGYCGNCVPDPTSGLKVEVT